MYVVDNWVLPPFLSTSFFVFIKSDFVRNFSTYLSHDSSLKLFPLDLLEPFDETIKFIFFENHFYVVIFTCQQLQPYFYKYFGEYLDFTWIDYSIVCILNLFEFQLDYESSPSYWTLIFNAISLLSIFFSSTISLLVITELFSSVTIPPAFFLWNLPTYFYDWIHASFSPAKLPFFFIIQLSFSSIPQYADIIDQANAWYDFNYF